MIQNYQIYVVKYTNFLRRFRIGVVYHKGTKRRVFKYLSKNAFLLTMEGCHGY